jgi:hypothetical protein
LKAASISPLTTLVVFIDELNTAGALGAVTETVATGTLDGLQLPDNVMFVAAINPPTITHGPSEYAGVEGFASANQCWNTVFSAQTAATGTAADSADIDLEPEDEKEEYMPSFVIKPLPQCLEPFVSVHQGMLFCFQTIVARLHFQTKK